MSTAATSSMLTSRRIRLPFFKRRSVSEWMFFTCFLLYILVCGIIYFQYVQPWIDGHTATRIGADSDRLWDSAKQAQQSGREERPLVSATGNLLGPVTEALLLQNGFGVMCFNIALFCIAVKVASSIPGVNTGLLGFLFLLNAELLPALTTLNKEILSLLASVLTAKYLYEKKPSKLLLLIVIAISLFARWEQAAILLVYFLLTRFWFKNRPWRAILFLVAVITVAYPFSFKLLGIDPHSLDWLMEGATTQLWLNNIQDHYGFFLLVVPKVLFLITGELHSPQYYNSHYWSENFALDPQNMLFLPLACVAFIAVFVYALWTKRMRLNRPVALLSAITLIIIAASPFTQPRYIFGVYAMLCIDIARPKELGDPEGGDPLEH